MTQMGERYWRLYVETQALATDREYKLNLIKLHGQMRELWEILPREDVVETNQRVKIARGYELRSSSRGLVGIQDE